MENVKVNAVMLRAVDYLENDKILTLYTAERGRISAGIKGVKKAGAKLKFATQPFCFAEYILAPRGDRYTVVQASECESFYELRTDVNKFYAACAACETVIALTEECDAEEGLFTSLVRTLGAMCDGDEGEALITFLLDALKGSGYGISFGGCAVCKKSLEGAEKARFNFTDGSFTCWDCGVGAGVSGETYSALRNAAGDASVSVSDGGKKRALKLLREYIVRKLDADCVSLAQYIDFL